MLKEDPFKVGDKVWFRQETIEKGKLEPNWKYKGTIIKVYFKSAKTHLESSKEVIAHKVNIKRRVENLMVGNC